MFKILLTLVLILSTVKAGLYTSIRGLSLEEHKPDKIWSLDTIGENVRVYEFTTKTYPLKKCIIVFTENNSKSPVMQCYNLSK